MKKFILIIFVTLFVGSVIIRVCSENKEDKAADQLEQVLHRAK